MRKNLLVVFSLLSLLIVVLTPAQSFADSERTTGKTEGHGPCATSGNADYQKQGEKDSESICYAIRSIGPDGGMVFYVDSSVNGFAEPGATCNLHCHYLEAAPTSTTLHNYWADVMAAWSRNTSTSIGNTSTSIGAGYSNTSSMIASGAGISSAAFLARAYRGPNNKRDWFLPSKDELNQLWPLAKATVEGFVFDHYWSSSEYSVSDCNSDPQCWPGANIAWNLHFMTGAQWVSSKDNTYYVRPVRAF
jgi:hypothetical protein